MRPPSPDPWLRSGLHSLRRLSVDLHSQNLPSNRLSRPPHQNPALGRLNTPHFRVSFPISTFRTTSNGHGTRFRFNRGINRLVLYSLTHRDCFSYAKFVASAYPYTLSSPIFRQPAFAFSLAQTEVEFQPPQELMRGLKAWGCPYLKDCGRDFLG